MNFVHVRICEKSLRQNLNQPMRKHQNRLRAPNKRLIAATCRRITECRRGDLSPRCVAAICRIVCLGQIFFKLAMQIR